MEGVEPGHLTGTSRFKCLQKRRFERASAVSAIARIATIRCIAAVHGETGEAD
jgi:hypothetical protein